MKNSAKFLICLMFGALIGLSGCKESAPQAGKKKASDSDADPIDDGTKDSYTPDPCSDSSFDLKNSKKVSKKTPKKKTPKMTGFSLANDVTWDSDIEKIIKTNCLSCHDSGGTNPDLSSFSKVRSSAAGVEDTVIEKSSMPPSGAIGSSDRTKLKDWFAADMPESSSSNDSSDDDDDDDEDDFSDPCESSTNDDDDDDDDDNDDDFTASDWNDLLNPPKLKECKDDGKVYDRAKDECHKAKTDISYACTWDGIKAAFDGVNVENDLNSFKSDGFEIDQCGQYKDDPIIYFIKKTTPDNAMGLKIRKICKTGTDACS